MECVARFFRRHRQPFDAARFVEVVVDFCVRRGQPAIDSTPSKFRQLAQRRNELLTHRARQARTANKLSTANAIAWPLRAIRGLVHGVADFER